MSDWIVFWHRHYQKPVFTETDWKEYFENKKRRIAVLSANAVSRFVNSLGRNKVR